MKKLVLCFTGLLFLSGIAYSGQPQNIGYSKTDNPFQLYSITVAAKIALAPDTTGQIIHCSDCVQTPVCVSTGVGTGAWVAVAVSTGSTANTFGACR